MSADRPVGDLLRVAPGSTVHLVDVDPRSTPGTDGDKARAAADLDALGAELSVLQEQLYAEGRTGGRRRVLVVLQGMDTSGKGGAVKRVAGLMNPAAFEVTGFAKPTPEELAHDFTWRFEQALPGQAGGP